LPVFARCGEGRLVPWIRDSYAPIGAVSWRVSRRRPPPATYYKKLASRGLAKCGRERGAVGCGRRLACDLRVEARLARSVAQLTALVAPPHSPWPSNGLGRIPERTSFSDGRREAEYANRWECRSAGVGAGVVLERVRVRVRVRSYLSAGAGCRWRGAGAARRPAKGATTAPAWVEPTAIRWPKWAGRTGSLAPGARLLRRSSRSADQMRPAASLGGVCGDAGAYGFEHARGEAVVGPVVEQALLAGGVGQEDLEELLGALEPQVV